MLLIKNKNQQTVGFTLIEVLLVIAIIGILAAVVFAMIGNSDNTKVKSVLSTAKSIMPYAQECHFKGESLVSPNPSNGSGSGDVICNGSQTEWPKLGVSGCVYYDVNNSGYKVDCSGEGIATDIICETVNGSCFEQQN